MGKPCAVVFACIFMGLLERKALSLAREKLMVPLYYKRFIDDILIIADSIAACELIKQTLNQVDPFIRVTGTTSNYSTNFLDLTIYKEPDFDQTHILDLDLYQKPSNKFLFLPTLSEHAPHVPKGWITGYIRRIRTNCTRDPNYFKRCTDFAAQLQARGHSNSSLQTYFQYNPDRKKILQSINLKPKQTNAAQTVPLLFKLWMSTRTVRLLRQLKRALRIDQAPLEHATFSKKQLSTIFHDRKGPTICLYNAKNIGARIVSAKLHPPKTNKNPKLSHSYLATFMNRRSQFK